MEIYNILKLTNSQFIEFEFNTELEKYNLPIFTFVKSGDNENLILEYIYDVECYKISKDWRKIAEEKYIPIYRYKIVGTYDNYLDMIKIIDVIKKYIYGKIILMINNDRCKNLIDRLIDLDCFNTLVLGKKFTNPTYSLDKMNGIEYVVYKSNKINKIPILPHDIQILKINLNNQKICCKLIHIPNGVKKIIYKKLGNYYWITDMENINVKKILFVDECKCHIKQNAILDNYDCLIYWGSNNLIDFQNLSSGVKVLKLLDLNNFSDSNFDYLPDSIESIHFPFLIDGKKLSNFPSSIKKISFDFVIQKVASFENKTYTTQFSPNELPDSIEIIELNLFHNYGWTTIPEIKHLPKMLKKININYMSKIPSIKDKFVECKKIFNLNFLINENFKDQTNGCDLNIFSSLNFTTWEKIENYMNLSVEYKKNNRKYGKYNMANNKKEYYETKNRWCF